MKFTNGYWMIRQEFQMSYAIEAYRMKRTSDALCVLASCKHVAHRGDILNEGTIQVRFTTPTPDVIRVEAVHFKGAKDPCVHFPILDVYKRQISSRLHPREPEKRWDLESPCSSMST